MYNLVRTGRASVRAKALVTASLASLLLASNATNAGAANEIKYNTPQVTEVMVNNVWYPRVHLTGPYSLNYDTSGVNAVDAGGFGIQSQTFDVKAGATFSSAPFLWSIWGYDAAEITAIVAGDVTGPGNALTFDTFGNLAGNGNITVNGGGTSTSTAGAALWTLNDDGATNVTGMGKLDGTTFGILGTSTTGVLNYSGNSDIDGNFGVRATTTTGAINVDNNGNITAVQDSVWIDSAGGNLSVSGNTDIKGGESGVAAFTAGAGTVTVSNNGAITGGAIDAGVWTTANTGATKIENNGAISGAIGVLGLAGSGPVSIVGNNGITGTVATGVRFTSTSGPITVDNNKNITAKTDGVWINSATGNLAVTNNGDITAPESGVAAFTAGAGTVTVSNNGNITGGTEPGIWTTAATGATSINGNGNITSTADEGITSISIGGAIGIGDTAFNGEIKGATYGIYADSTAGAGPVTIKVNKNVTGNGIDGILAASTGGTGTILIDILDPAVVSGGLHGVTMSTNGSSMLNNAGTIKQIGDTGLAGVGGGNAIYSPFGSNVVNNKSGGDIIGTIFTGGTAFTLNNEAGGVWTPGSDAANIVNAFTLNDKVNNAGLINVRQGDTTLTNLGMLNNMAGGVIDMTYAGTSPSADEDLKTVGFTAGAGSTVKFNVDFTKSHSLNDSSTGNGGNGRGDTIIVTGKATPVATSTLDVSAIGAPAIGSSGSIALIDTIASPLSDPGLGGLSTILGNISTNYVLANPLTTGAVRVEIVESKLGGAYLQWAPNITAESLGGFFGGTLGDAASGGSQAAAASGGAGGGLGPNGGPSGGGAAGQVADLAASNASSRSGIAGASGGAQCGDGSRMTAWASGDGAGTRFDGGGKGSNINGAFGIERDVSEDACGQIALGAFGTVGTSKTSWASGSSDSDSWGAGAYARVGSLSGFYATALGAVNWSEADLTNNVFLSTATQKSTGYLGNFNAGHISNLTDATTLDLRAFASFAHVNGGGFTDSRGITVDGSESDTTVLGALVGLETDFSDNLSGFSRVGLRHVWIAQSSTAFGTTVSGKSDTTYASAEAGVRASLADNASLTLSGNSDLSKYSKTWGLNMGLAIRF